MHLRIKDFIRRGKIHAIILILAVLLLLDGILSAVYFFNIPSAVAIRAVPRPLREAAGAIVKFAQDLPYFKYRFLDDKIVNYKLIIKPSDYNKLNANLPSPTGDLTKEFKDDVPAKLLIGKASYKVSVHYRGETSVHWLYPKKSWRIKFIEPRAYNGMHEADLIVPNGRGYIMEAFNNYRAKKIGLKAPFDDFINLEVNGKNNGSYFLIAHWNKETMERMGLDSDTNFYGERSVNEPIFTDLKYWQKYLSNSKYQKNDYSDLEYLISLVARADQKEFEAKIFTIIDKDNFFRWWMHQILSGSNHQDWAHNIRLYFDKTLGKFIFIPWDVGGTRLNGGIFSEYNPLINRIAKNNAWRAEIIQLLWDYVKDENNLKNDLEYYDGLNKKIAISIYKDRLKEFNNSYAEKEISEYRAIIENNFKYIKNTIEKPGVSAGIYSNFSPSIPLMIELEVNAQTPVTLQKIKIGNLFNLRVYLDSNKDKGFDSQDKYLGNLDSKGVFAADKAMSSDLDVAAQLQGSYENIKVIPGIYNLFFVGEYEKPFAPGKIVFDIKNNITGGSVQTNDNYFDQEMHQNRKKMNLSAEEFARANPIFITAGENKLMLYSAKIFEDIIIPPGLQIIVAPGSDIFLAEGASIISYSPFFAEGTENKKISFRPLAPGKPWGALAIISAEKSIFKHTVFSGGKDEYSVGLFASGMLSLYGTDAEIKNSEFSLAAGDDALNIKNARADVSGSYFYKNSADAIDFDFVEGGVFDSKFIENGNDGVDLSGSRALIKNNLIKQSGDKCVSVGEQSRSVIFNNRLIACGTGIAVKDLSEAEIVNNVLYNNNIGVALFQKKDFFGGGEAKVANSIIWGGQKRIEIDSLSKVKISHSDIEGGWEGSGNRDIAPKFLDIKNDNYKISAEQTELNYGDKEAAKDFYDMASIINMPVGLAE